MAGSKECSATVLDGLFSPLYSKSTGIRFIVMTSSGPAAGIVAASSPSSSYCLAWGPTSTDSASTGYFLIGTTGTNRYCTIGACSCDEVIWSGAAACVVIAQVSSELLYVTTCTTQALTSGSKVNVGSWQITVNQPT